MGNSTIRRKKVIQKTSSLHQKTYGAEDTSIEMDGPQLVGLNQAVEEEKEESKVEDSPLNRMRN